MANSDIRLVKPTTSGSRHMSYDSFNDITAKKPHKALTIRLKSHAGRDDQGKISVRHRGGGVKRLYRIVDFSLLKHIGDDATIETIEYDPYRSARVALVKFNSGKHAYVIASQDMKVGDIMKTGKDVAAKPGNRLALKDIPTGTPIFNLELTPGKGGQLVRSAGTSATIVAKEGDYVSVRLPSTEIRLIHNTCFASIGEVSNPAHNTIRIAKAGRMRHMGRRPTVRGKAMNPVDHPHGGGEGNTSIGLIHPKTPTGKPALGHTTRHNQRTNRFIIKRRGQK